MGRRLAEDGGLRLPPSLCKLRRTSRLNPPYGFCSSFYEFTPVEAGVE